jgi:hypothetical protein
MIDQKSKLRVSTGMYDDQLRDALKDIFQHYGYDLTAMPADSLTAAKTDIATRLSEVARHDPPWGWRYVHNFMAENIQAGQEFKAAIIGLAAMIDGMPMQLIQGRTIQITALGNVRPGALVYGDSRKCANIACPVHFVPRAWNQKFCSPECKRAARKAK